MNAITLKYNNALNLYKILFLYLRLDLKKTKIKDIIYFYIKNPVEFEKVYNQDINKKHTFEYYKIKILNEKINEFSIVKSKKLNQKDKSSLIAQKNINLS